MRGKGKDWKREGRRKGMDSGLGRGVLLTLGEPKSSLEELELPLRELEPTDDGLATFLTMENFSV